MTESKGLKDIDHPIAEVHYTCPLTPPEDCKPLIEEVLHMVKIGSPGADPTQIMQTASAFWASKVLLTAVELDLFSTLDDESMTASQPGETLGLHPRGTYDFFDALVALRFLDRAGERGSRVQVIENAFRVRRKKQGGLEWLKMHILEFC